MRSPALASRAVECNKSRMSLRRALQFSRFTCNSAPALAVGYPTTPNIRQPCCAARSTVRDQGLSTVRQETPTDGWTRVAQAGSGSPTSKNVSGCRAGRACPPSAAERRLSRVRWTTSVAECGKHDSEDEPALTGNGPATVRFHRHPPNYLQPGISTWFRPAAGSLAGSAGLPRRDRVPRMRRVAACVAVRQPPSSSRILGNPIPRYPSDGRARPAPPPTDLRCPRVANPLEQTGERRVGGGITALNRDRPAELTSLFPLSAAVDP